MRTFSGEMPQVRCHDRDPQFVQACAVEMHMDMSREPFYAKNIRRNAMPQRDSQTATHTLCKLAQSKRTWTCHKSPCHATNAGQQMEYPD